ncbi:hypothetical protein BGW42_008355 [Actinomortierella wolfii]|nr:hypothetical protein BGW42_008355 [Actinomortierella wolfii]
MTALHTAYIAFVAFVACFQTICSAQYSQPPTPVTGPAFARTKTSLYIQGGSIDSRDPNPIRTGQFYRLDLSVPWNTSRPAWYKLRDGPVNTIFPAVFSLDEKTMITFHSGTSTTFAYKYSVDTDSWSPSTLRVNNPDWQGISAVTDLSTGLVYLAAGYSSGARDNMDVFDFAIDDIRSTKLPPGNQVFEARAYYTNVYSKARNSILYFGGYNASLQVVENAVVSEYKTTGTGPSSRADHCMAINDDGTKVIVYGGRLPTGFNGDIFILDLKTTSWTKGLAGPVRLYTTCVIAGDLFITWGGNDGTQTVGFGATTVAPLIYNITADRWVTDYIPPASYVPPPPANHGNEDGGDNVEKSTKSNNVGAIAGGVAAAVAVVAAVAIFIFMRRRKTTKDTGKGSGTQYTYAAVAHQDSPPSYGSAPVSVAMAAPAPVPDAEAQIFSPSHSYQPPILQSVPTTMSTSSSPYSTPVTQATIVAPFVPTSAPYVSTAAPFQDPVKAMAVHTPDIPLHQEAFTSHSKDCSVDGNTGKPMEYPLSTMDAGSPVTRPGNPQAIVTIPESRRGNPQALLEQQQQHSQ